MKLPHYSLANPRPNLQLPDLVDPLLSNVQSGGSGLAVGHLGDLEPGVGAGVAIPGVSPGQESRSLMCHVECCAGLGGEVICVFSDDEDAVEIGSENDSDISPQPVLCKPLLSTPKHLRFSQRHS